MELRPSILKEPPVNKYELEKQESYFTF